RPRRGRHAVLFTEAQRRVARNDAPDAVDDQLDAAIEQVSLALDGHELARVELLVVHVDVLEELGDDLARDVLQDEREVGRVAARPPLLAGAEEEAGSDRRSINGAGWGQTRHIDTFPPHAGVCQVYRRMLESAVAATLPLLPAGRTLP